MRKIIFQEIGMKNFQIYTEPMIHEIKNGSITLIVGPNGSGKTTIFDCFPYTLYGVTSRGARGDDVVNNKSKKNCHTWVKWIENDIEYAVNRYYKHSKYGNDVVLLRDGKIIKRGQREVKPELEKLILPQKLFSNTLLFEQRAKTFFTDLTDSEQKEIFKKIINLDAYTAYRVEAGKLENEINKEMEEIGKKHSYQDGLLTEIESSINALIIKKQEFENSQEQRIQELNISIGKLQEDLKELQNSYDESKMNSLKLELETNRLEAAAIKNEMEQFNAMVSRKIQEINNETQAKINVIDEESNKKIAKYTSELQEMKNEELKDLVVVLKTLQNKLSGLQGEKYDIQTELSNITNNIKRLEEEKQSLESNVKKEVATCPTCGQTINSDIIAKFENTIDELTNKIETLVSKKELVESEVKSLATDIENNTNEIKRLTEEKDKIEGKYHAELRDYGIQVKANAKDAISILRQEAEEKINTEKEEGRKKWNILLEKSKHITELKTKIEETIQSHNELKDKISVFVTTINSQNNELNRVKNEKFDDSYLNSSREKLVAVKQSIKNLQNELLKLEKEKANVLFWKEGFSNSGIQSMLIDEAIPFLNQKSSEYLERIGGRYTVSFDTLKETKSGEFRDKISVNVFDSVSWADKRVQFSGGQIRVVDIAIILALGNLQEKYLGISFNILLFDEIFDALDDKNAEYVCSLLQTVKGNKSVNIISHKNIDSIDADNTLRLT